MTINLSTLFTRLGQRFGEIDQLRTLHNTTTPTDWGNRPEALGAFQRSLAAVRGSAQQILIQTVRADNPGVPARVKDCAEELIRQMIGSGTIINADNDVDANSITVGAATAASTNTGSGTVVVSATAPRGHGNEYARSETLLFECLENAQGGRTRTDGPLFRVSGQPMYSNDDPRFPGGSGINFQCYATDPSVDSGTSPGENVLFNSDFEDFSSNVPVGWTLSTGTAGVHMLSTSNAHLGSSAVEIVGDGANLTAFFQRTASSTDTRGTIKGLRTYCIGFWLRHAGVLPAAGSLVVELLNTATGSVYNSTTATYDLTNAGVITNSYQLKTIILQANSDVPAQCSLRFRLATAITAGRSIYIDSAFIAEMHRPHVNGPAVLVVPGRTAFVPYDRFTVAITNNYAGDIQRYADQAFDLYQLGLHIPSDTGGGETILDSNVA